MPNDFLSALSSRALNNPKVDPATEGLKPRLASHFEPPEHSVMVGMDETIEVAGLDDVKAARGAEPGNLSQATGSDHLAARGFQSPQKDQETPALTMRPRLKRDETIRSIERDQVQSSLDRIEPVHAQASFKESPSVSSSGHFETTTQPTRRTTNERDSQPVLEPQQSYPIASSSYQGSATETYERQDHENTLPAPIISSGHQSLTPKDAVIAINPESHNIAAIVPEQVRVTQSKPQSLLPEVEPRLVPAMASPERKSQSGSKETEPQAPTIHVSIGRVEVRAALPAIPPKRSVPNASIMSLEEYLRRREEGRR